MGSSSETGVMLLVSILDDCAPHDLCPIPMFSARDLLCASCSEVESKGVEVGVGRIACFHAGVA